MEQYTVTGMSCAACAARVEKAVSGVPGVTTCSVSLLTNSMGVEGTASPADIVAAVEAAGYGAAKKGVEKRAAREAELEDTQTPKLIRRLIASLCFLLPLLYVSMGHMMWNWPLPVALHENPLAIALAELLLTTVVMVINQRFFVSGVRGLLHGAPNMDTLVSLGASASYGYSICMLFAMTGSYMAGDMTGGMAYLHELYFESAATILTLITVGKTLEAYSKGRTTDALKGLMKLSPQTAVVLRGEQEVTVPIEQVHIGDLFVVRPGEQIPVDGFVREGVSAVNEAALTGESIPVDKAAGDPVSAATMNQSGFLTCEATRVGEDTTLSQIISLVSDAAATKAPIAKIADRVSGIFVPTVMIIAAVTILLWFLTGQTIGFALSRGISVLVISCPCALGLATPVAIMVGNGKGAKNGIMFKTAASLEAAGRTQIVVLDKTGTITKGEPSVTDLLPAEGVSEEELLYLADCLEEKSEHPLARAIVTCARERDLKKEGGTALTNFQSAAGNGLTGDLGSDHLVGGHEAFVRDYFPLTQESLQQANALAKEGKTPLFFGRNQTFLGIIAVADVIKEDSAEAIAQLKAMGLRVVMLTGDHELTAQAIGQKAGVDHVIAQVRPDEKEAVIRKLTQIGKVAMVGDGINDAPALTRADIGIAIGAGTDIAIDAADIVLLKSQLSDVAGAIRLGRSTLRNIHQNLFWAFFYNVIGIPLAAGVWYPLLGLLLNPMFAAAAMSLSSFFVVSNALRLNLCHIYDTGKDQKKRKTVSLDAVRAVGAARKEEPKEVLGMTKTMKIDGMMCEHCEARVKKALEAVEGVEKADVSYQEGRALVTLDDSVSEDMLKQAVEAEDYAVLGIE